jgi:hypothetical protein
VPEAGENGWEDMDILCDFAECRRTGIPCIVLFFRWP